MRTIVNTDGIINCLRQPGQDQNRPEQSMRVTLCRLLNFVYHDRSCYRDKVIGLPADAPLTVFLPCHLSNTSGKVIYESSISTYSPDFAWKRNFGAVCRENTSPTFAWTEKSVPFIRDLAKNAGTRTRTATNYNHRAVVCNRTNISSIGRPLRKFAL